MIRRACAVSLLLAGLLGTGCRVGGETIDRVVIVSLDTTRADRLGCYGYEAAKTPHLDGLADEAALFENAISPVPTTLPSHSTIFTGLYPQDHGVRYNLVFNLGPEAVTLAEVLAEAGFETAGFPSAFVLQSRYGLDQGFDTYAEPPGARPTPEEPYAQNGLPAGMIVDRALSWLDEHLDDGRQFLWLHFYDPHAPYSPPFPYSSEFRDHPYDGELAYADAQLGRLLERLRRDPEWSRTLLIVVGDHGEGLHEHGERFHANLVYETTQHVPLIIRAPGASAVRVAEPVSLVDLMPTVLDYVGIDFPGEVRGTTLRDGIEGGSVGRRDIYFESLAGSLNYGWAELRGVRYGEWKLIDSELPELFQLREDPGEIENLAELETQQVEDLRAYLDALKEPLGEQTPARQSFEPGTDPETEAFLAGLGYVAGGFGGSSTEGAALPRDQIDLEGELLAAQASVAEQDWATVEDVCRYVLGRDHRNKWALVNLSAALMWTGRFAEARDHALEMIRLYPDNEQGYSMAARAYRGEGEKGRAREVLARGLEKLPESVGLRYLYLVAGFDLELDSVCAEEVPQAVEQHPESGVIRVLRSRCEAISGDPERALATLREAVALGFDGLPRLAEAEEFSEVIELEGFQDLVSESESDEKQGAPDD
jgi:arylsulfatase A-like enzyme